MADYVKAAKLDQVPPGTGVSVKVGDKDVALFNVEGAIYAIDDTCAHAGASLGAGKFEGKIVTCRAHGLRYDVTTGCLTSSPSSGVKKYLVNVVNGEIMVAIDTGVAPGVKSNS